ncbi:Cupin 2 conserved barrel domain protein [Parafrankia sp. EAN1pec]|uniref:cupin domain-containing protein n=1 Tax=Parafrankia sp. (strain EAN1pec) TaxID=298653 RepID=UPI0000540E1E|nr:Cupin 2 conserved barrel domain protein [Frankia sp. EAN1pec]
MTFNAHTPDAHAPDESPSVGPQPVRGFARGRDEGRRIDLPNWSMLVKVTAGDTLGRLTVLEGRMGPRQPGPLPHVHEGHDETFVLVEGRLRFRVGNGFHTAAAGETVFAGRRLAHGFGNPFAEPARYIAILTPSGYEDYFDEVAEHAARTGSLPGEALTRELMARHRTVLAPPLPDPGAAPPPEVDAGS